MTSRCPANKETCASALPAFIVINMKPTLNSHTNRSKNGLAARASYLAALLFLPTSLLAQTVAETVTEPDSPPPDLNFAQVMMPMVMVVALIFILAWVIKYFNPRLQATGGKDIEILANKPVTNQARLSLVRVGGKDLLVGITPSNITLIKDFDAPIIDKTQTGNQTDLSEQFKKLLRRDSPKS